MPAVEAGAAGTGFVGTATRGGGDAAGEGAAATAAAGAGRDDVWTAGRGPPFGATFLGARCATGGAVAAAGGAGAGSAAAGMADSAIVGTAGDGAEATTGGLAKAGGLTTGAAGGVARMAATAARARACVGAWAGSVVAIKALVVTVASHATATPNHPMPPERRADVSAYSIGTSASRAYDSTGWGQRAEAGHVGCAALASGI